MKNINELHNSNWSPFDLTLNDRLEIIPNGTYGTFLLLLNKIKKLIGLDHFSTDLDDVLPQIESFIRRIDNQEDGNLLSNLLMQISSQCSSFQQQQKIEQILNDIEAVFEPHKPPRRVKVIPKWTAISQKIIRKFYKNTDLNYSIDIGYNLRGRMVLQHHSIIKFPTLLGKQKFI